MIDHVGVNVSEYETSKRFYEQALAPIGYRRVMDFPEHDAAGFGTDGKPELWVVARDPRGTGTHLAFVASDRPTVDAFHAAALAAGGVDNGQPGVPGRVPADLLRSVRARSGREQRRGCLPRARVTTSAPRLTPCPGSR